MTNLEKNPKDVLLMRKRRAVMKFRLVPSGQSALEAMFTICRRQALHPGLRVKTHMTRTEENVMRKHTDKDSPCPYILHL
jgi:hypothetical protein